MSKSIFISRDLNEDDLLFANLASAGFEVHAFSLIEIEETNFILPKLKFDWVFLASSNAARIFLPSYSSSAKLAAVGLATAKVITDFGFEVSFTGSGGDMIEVGKRFSRQIDSQKVLFPSAEGGSKRIQSQIREDQIIDLPIYRTIAKQDVKIPETDIVFLSSPSNAKAYIAKLNLNGKTTIAIGQTTKEFLNENGIKNVLVPPSPDPDSILDLIFRL
ncbi:MAG: uroporphyrinogen-III synthase [Flavobacteriales bacterium]